MHRFQIIPIFLRTAAAGDILVATHGNFSVLRPPRVLVEQNIQLPPLVNSSDLDILGHARIHVNAEPQADIILPALTNVSSLAGGSPSATFVEVAEAPPDGFIRLPSLVNASVLSGGSPSAALVTVGVAPPDENIRLPALINSSVLTHGSPPLTNVSVEQITSIPTETDDNNDPMVAGGMLGGRVI